MARFTSYSVTMTPEITTASSLIPFLLAASTLALPTVPVACSLSSAQISTVLPYGQTNLTAPSAAPEFIGLGVGVQNYTCNTTSSTYVLFGAVAELFDLSCVFSEPSFASVQEKAFSAWTAAPDSVDVFAVISDLTSNSAVLGQHYYVNNPAPSPGASATTPKFDFTANVEKGNSNAFVVAAKVGDLAAPTGKTDVDWVQLKEIQGGLASQVFRTNTHGGQPPTSGSTSRGIIGSGYWAF
ncbi:hypothetical protein HWV62_35204 [Athelia sp. TMB]|nr:hypothetical protein HWV62_35204 [Athelia sp. TMB]